MIHKMIGNGPYGNIATQYPSADPSVQRCFNIHEAALRSVWAGGGIPEEGVPDLCGSFPSTNDTITGGWAVTIT